jgi:hypothetical protein
MKTNQLLIKNEMIVIPTVIIFFKSFWYNLLIFSVGQYIDFRNRIHIKSSSEIDNHENFDVLFSRILV